MACNLILAFWKDLKENAGVFGIPECVLNYLFAISHQT